MKSRNSVIFSFIVSLLMACGGGDNPPATSEPTITVKFTVTNLPESLPINLAALKSGTAEYGWEVIFDLDDNLARSTGDLQLAFGHIKFDGAPTTAKVSEFEAILLHYTSDSSIAQVNTVKPTVSITDNTITLTMIKSQSALLAKVTKNTKVQFQSVAYDESGEIYADNYPVIQSQATFASIPADGKFTDGPDPFVLPFIDLVSMEIHID